MSTTSTSRRPWRCTAAAVIAATALAGCTSGGSGGGDSGSADSAAIGAAEGGRAAESTMTDLQSRASGSTAAQQVGLLSRDVIQRADVRIRARDVGAALVRTRSIVAAVRGEVAEERTQTGRRGDPRRSAVTLRVPVDAFSAVLADLADLGRLRSQQVTSEDVSTEVVDVDARIASAERTIERLRELLEAADDFSDILTLEGELARREADLASLRAQQAYLQDQTSLSTIQLTLLPVERADEEPDDEATGFVGGLGVGWDALVGLVTVLLTALGVLLPMLVLLLPAAALVWWALRRALRRRPAQSPPPTAA